MENYDKAGLFRHSADSLAPALVCGIPTTSLQQIFNERTGIPVTLVMALFSSSISVSQRWSLDFPAVFGSRAAECSPALISQTLVYKLGTIIPLYLPPVNTLASLRRWYHLALALSNGSQIFTSPRSPTTNLRYANRCLSPFPSTRTTSARTSSAASSPKSPATLQF